MSVVHVAHGGLSATICPIAGLAILPPGDRFRIYHFSYANGRDGAGCESSKELPGLPWDNCVKFERIGPNRLVITLQDAQDNIPTQIYFQIIVGLDLTMTAKIKRLQQWFQRALPVHRRLRQQQEKLEVLGMGLHPRLGASSPITVDILQMLAEHSLV